MRKKFLILLLIPLTIFSCKKNDIEESDEKQFDVKFSAKLFDQTIEPFGSKAERSIKAASGSGSVESSEMFDTFTCFIFDENEKYVTSKSRIVVDMDHNFLKDSLYLNFKLPKGKYKVGFTGNIPYSNNIQNAKDVFSEFGEVHKFSSSLVPITITGNNVFDPVELNRLTSKVEFNFVDNTPSEKVSIEFKARMPNRINPFYPISQLDMFYTIIKNWSFPVNSIIPTQSIIAFPDLTKESTSISFDILIYNESKALIGQKNITDVIIKKNHITKLTGKLFDGIGNTNGNGSFHASAIPDYNSSVLEQTF